MQQEYIDETITEIALYQANKLFSWVLERFQEYEQLNTRARKPSQIPEKQPSQSAKDRNVER